MVGIKGPIKVYNCHLPLLLFGVTDLVLPGLNGEKLCLFYWYLNALFCHLLTADQNGTWSLDELSASTLNLEWNSYGVDVEAIVMKSSVNYGSLSHSAGAVIGATTAITSTATLNAMIVKDWNNACVHESTQRKYRIASVSIANRMDQDVVSLDQGVIFHIYFMRKACV